MRSPYFGFALTVVLLGLLSSCSSLNTTKPENVSYKSVVALLEPPPNQVFAYGSDTLQFAEFWAASGTASLDAPLVVFIHGGCWLNSYDIAHSRAMSRALAAEGFNVWSLEYRRTGDEGGGWPGTFDDILLALRHLAQENPAELDLSQVALVGHSAGGHLALLAGAYPSSLGLGIDKIVGLAAINNLTDYAKGDNSCQKAALEFIGHDTGIGPHASVADPSKLTPHSGTILLHGDKDMIVPLEQTLGSDRKYIIIEGAGHFDFLHPGTDAFTTLVNILNSP